MKQLVMEVRYCAPFIKKMIKLLMLNLQKCMEGSKKMIYITGDERFHIIFPQLKKIEEHLKKEGRV